MKFNDKQINDLCKLLGGVALSAVIGFAIALSGHNKDITEYDKFGLALSFLSCTIVMLLLRRGR